MEPFCTNFVVGVDCLVTLRLAADSEIAAALVGINSKVTAAAGSHLASD